MTSDVSLDTVSNQINKTATSKDKLSKDYTEFLKLLTTQLQNQDPLNPMDSTEFTNQLVQFSQVEQAINSNQKLDSLLSLQLSNVASTALGYVGLDINYTSAELNFDGAKPVNINYALNTAATTSKINIINKDGNVIYSANAGTDTGKHAFKWDGKTTDGLTAPAGTYTVRIDALDADGKAISTTTVVSGHVHGIETQDGVINLLVGDRAVPVGNVLNATQPETAT